MELRDIEIFLTLAEELHFGRTAERLRLTPARVSQAIKKQERSLGGLLFERTSRTVRLTPLGRQLRDDLQPIRLALRETMRRARATATGTAATLRIGMMSGNLHDLRPYWDAFRARHPRWELQFRHAPFVDPFGGLRRGEVDVLVTWSHIEEPDLTVGPALHSERRVLAVAAGHELAGRPSVTLEALADFQHSGAVSVPDYWEAGYVPFHTPSGRPIERGPAGTSAEAVLTLVSSGEVVNIFPAHASRYWARPDIVWLPVTDMDPFTSSLAWRGEAENDVIRALADVVRDLGVPGAL
ncbi:LysR family transcriptional regulator [Nonomuraea sp. 3-1Str]|uniref:LysR family transcriptional regulator n=1 Tax=Nonomuraea sp. 3-1Str TaxID=2929801 RepID=UPI002862A3D5|nr:LysR family transcriptional regulator [Nonomuraea sp. 3-1Str]MDR8414407.1 LysR family transcriptional regulator [Nonomuraea sp. 3-1Str]